MGTEQHSINLLRTQSALSPEEMMFLSRLRIISMITTVVILSCGFFVSMAFLAAKLRFDGLTNERKQVTQKLALNARKEAMYVALLSRIPLIDKGLKSQYPWDKIMNAVIEIVTPPRLTALAIDSNNILTLSISAGSVDELKTIVDKTQELARANRLKNPRIGSFDAHPDGNVDAEIEFIPGF